MGSICDLLFVVFTERKENIRLISARLAIEAEGSLYYDQVFQLLITSFLDLVIIL